MGGREGKNTDRNSPVEWNWLGADSIIPKLPALMRIQIIRSAAMMNMKGAPKACRWRIDSTPRHTTTMLRSQKNRKLDQSTPVFPASEGQITTSMASMAWPPIHD